ncbi:MAG: DoxX family protein [Prevotella sp.]|nr:DoxX family protein [Bacteroides sp.]MCM1366606.1 DoxX family protein [Prevotella sp.]MCM1437297.1 DoxX family protein [Prevotella sp.]
MNNKVISIRPCESTLGVKTGILDRMIPRSPVMQDYNTAYQNNILTNFLFPFQYSGVGKSFLYLSLRLMVSVLLFIIGIVLAINIPHSGIAGICEIIAGTAILIGICTRPVAILTTILLVLTSTHIGGWEQIITGIGSLLTVGLTFTGPGKISSDYLLQLMIKTGKK